MEINEREKKEKTTTCTQSTTIRGECTLHKELRASEMELWWSLRLYGLYCSLYDLLLCTFVSVQNNVFVLL